MRLKNQIDGCPAAETHISDAVISLSRREIIRTRFSDANFGFCRVKILGNASAFPAFFSCTRQNLLSENSFDLKLMNFCADFGASDEIRLTPIEDDKPKDAENSKFKASSDYLATAMSEKCHFGRSCQTVQLMHGVPLKSANRSGN